MSEQPQPPKEAAFFTTIRGWGLVRGANGILGGVVDGVGHRIGLARVPARLLTMVAWILMPGIVMLAYAAGWALLPDTKGNIIIQNFGRGITNVGALIGIAILTFLGIAGFDNGPVFNLAFGNQSLHVWEDVFGSGFLPRVAWVMVPVFFLLAFLAGLVVFVVWLIRRSNGNTADARVASAPHGTPATGAASAQANTHQAPGTPEPWEPALLPGDPRAGAPASSGAVRPAANATHSTGAAHSSASPTNPAAASAPPTPAPPAPPARPPAPTVPGPGRGAYLSFFAVLLISAAIVAWLSRSDSLAVMPIVAWGAAITVGLGAVLVIVALAGRKLGFLGFLSVFAVLLAVLFAANADEVRNLYETTWVWDEEVVTDTDDFGIEEGVDTTVDLTSELASNYSAVFIAGMCESPSEAEPWSEVKYFGDSMASMRLDAVDEDVEIDLVASYTRVEIPAGTSLEVVGSAYTSVVWEDRDASCSTWNDEYGYRYDDYEYDQPIPVTPQPLLSVTNPNTPVITINAGTDADKSIYIQEVAP